jgi:TPR repeat protein
MVSKGSRARVSVVQLALGHLLSEGQGVPKNDAEAVMWWRRAAEQGDATAQVNLGAAYQFGTGVPTDFSGAISGTKLHLPERLRR